MVRRALAVMLVLAACAGGPAPPPPIGDPLRFTVFEDRANETPCVAGPRFHVALDLDAWIDAYDIETACEEDEEIRLPGVPFGRRFGVVAWWGPACPGVTVSTTGADAAAGVVAVRARTSGPETCPASEGSVESFLSVQRPEGGIARVVFVLDAVVVGEVEF